MKRKKKQLNDRALTKPLTPEKSLGASVLYGEILIHKL
jgi:hypothetical protein